MVPGLSFDFLEQLKEQSVALKLLRSQNFSLAASFLYQIFVAANRRSVPYQELINLLDQHLFDIAESYGPERFPKTARNYLDDWVSNKSGYLRKFLPQDSDEPECDLVPEVEKALRWVEDLQGREFVGTESRLKLLLNLINELVQGTSDDQSKKLQQLQQRKTEIEQQIVAVSRGQDIAFSQTQIKERFYLLSDTSRQLLGDFRQVEANFRSLDRDARKIISSGGQYKASVLDKVFEHQDVIDNSDEGRSFSAFFELLMTPKMRSEMRDNLSMLLQKNLGHEYISQDNLLINLYRWLLDAGTKVNSTRLMITDQLRRYVQEQSQDNRRILELIREFETRAQRYQGIYGEADEGDFMQMEDMRAKIDPLLSRELWQPKAEEELSIAPDIASEEQDVDFTQLLTLSHIDEFMLQRAILQCLQDGHGQTTLGEVLERYPLRYGLDELLTYVKLACEQVITSNIDSYQQQKITWQSDEDTLRTVTIPKITFVRSL